MYYKMWRKNVLELLGWETELCMTDKEINILVCQCADSNVYWSLICRHS